MSKKKPIKISEKMKNGLDKIGHKNETYEDVLKRIIPQNIIKSWWGNK